jgi:hypothetical protein
LAAVRIFRLSGGRGWSVVKGTGPHGARVSVVGIYKTRDEALAAAKKIRGGKIAIF